jgi:arylsulfatase A-like enzyme
MSGKGLEHGAWKASWEGSSKFLRNSLGQRYLFDLEDDPDEMHNLAATEPARAARAERALDQAFAALPPPGFAAEVVVDDRTREALEQLGYLEETSSEARSHTRMEASE